MSSDVRQLTDDLVRTFEGIFPEQEIRGSLRGPRGFDLDEPLLMTGDDGYRSWAWSFEATHVGPLEGVAATGRTIRVEGVTLVGERGAVRYIDRGWLLAQMGAELFGRPSVRGADGPAAS